MAGGKLTYQVTISSDQSTWWRIKLFASITTVMSKLLGVKCETIAKTYDIGDNHD